MKRKKNKFLFVLSICILVISIPCGILINFFLRQDVSKDIPYTFNIGKTYKNHIEIKGQYISPELTGNGQYGIGDPFVMRFNGTYYLYPSSSEVGVKVFTSTNLVNWNYEGFATTEPVTYFAYAPEVTYYDGAFYMVTSPSGKGHYILKSDNPLGPFKLVTNNFGRSIDGSFWIKDDDKILLLYPQDSTIKSTEIDKATLTPIGLVTSLNATLKDWTEGPGIFRRDNMFYLTYTGNNVISDGYRVGYSYINGNNHPIRL